jgi:oligoendopeptidase F
MTTPSSDACDLAALPRYQPRRFVPETADLTDPAAVETLYKALEARPLESVEDVDAWLTDRSELESALDEAGSVLYVRMTCQTNDAARAEAYKAFVENVEPLASTLSDRLNRKYLAAREAVAPDAGRCALYDRRVRAKVDLFREANVPLKTQESLLAQDYQSVIGAMTVEFQGSERTLPEMGRFLHEPDRAVREAAWRAAAARRLADRERLDDIFDRMRDLRVQIAANAGCPDFIDYQFREYQRFDYTPEDCRTFHETAARCVVPLWRRILEDRQRRIGLTPLRPWDTAVDPEGRPPLAPFKTADELASRAAEVFRRTDPQLGRQFAGLHAQGLLDLASRKGKAPGGYQTSLEEARRPFIFMNAVGLDDDVRTLLHEGGHAFHSLAAADEPLRAYRHAPMEFCEVASMGMELLADDAIDVFYGPEDAARSRRTHLEGVVRILPWVATIDAFQHWLYSHPRHTRDQRRAAWVEVYDRFGGGVVDWTGLEDEKGWLWHRQLHIFTVPFYYIEYAIAQLGALQLWVRARKDPAEALTAYRRALALGGSRPLPELFEAAGLVFDFTEATVAPLMAQVEEACL